MINDLLRVLEKIKVEKVILNKEIGVNISPNKRTTSNLTVVRQISLLHGLRYICITPNIKCTSQNKQEVIINAVTYELEEMFDLNNEPTK